MLTESWRSAPWFCPIVFPQTEPRSCSNAGISNTVWVVPEFPRVEAIIRLIPYYTDGWWILCLDDDEFPPRTLIDWILDRLKSLDTNIIRAKLDL